MAGRYFTFGSNLSALSANSGPAAFSMIWQLLVWPSGVIVQCACTHRAAELSACGGCAQAEIGVATAKAADHLHAALNSASRKSFLVLFFKKELLPSYPFARST
jgi:hypothetical protein